MTSPHTPDPQWRLAALELEVLGPAALYANGNQQVVIQVYLKAVVGAPEDLDPVEVELTAQEVARLQIFTFETEQPVGWDQSGAGWSVSMVAKGYDPFPAAAVEPFVRSSPSRVGGQYWRFYVSGFRNADVVPGVPSRFVLSVRGDNGIRYLSNGKFWDAEGKRNDRRAFTSSVNITPVKTPDYLADNFRLSKTQLAFGTLDSSSVEPSDPVASFMFVLSLVVGGEVIKVRNLTSEPAGMIQWFRDFPGESFASYTGFAGPQDIAFQWNTNIGQGNSPAPSLPPSQRGKAILVLAGRVDIPYKPNQPGGPCALTIVDANGNSHHLNAQFADTPPSRWELTLTD